MGLGRGWGRRCRIRCCVCYAASHPLLSQDGMKCAPGLFFLFVNPGSGDNTTFSSAMCEMRALSETGTRLLAPAPLSELGAPEGSGVSASEVLHFVSPLGLLMARTVRLSPCRAVRLRKCRRPQGARQRGTVDTNPMSVWANTDAVRNKEHGQRCREGRCCPWASVEVREDSCLPAGQQEKRCWSVVRLRCPHFKRTQRN